MKIDDNGKYYMLPIVGKSVKEAEYNVFPVFHFSDESHIITLEIHGDFRIVYKEQEIVYTQLDDPEILLTFIGVEIIDARANKYGQLMIRFEDERELIVDDGPYENWHFYGQSKSKYSRNFHLGGGVGSTFLFK